MTINVYPETKPEEGQLIAFGYDGSVSAGKYSKDYVTGPGFSDGYMMMPRTCKWVALPPELI